MLLMAQSFGCLYFGVTKKKKKKKINNKCFIIIIIVITFQNLHNIKNIWPIINGHYILSTSSVQKILGSKDTYSK